YNTRSTPASHTLSLHDALPIFIGYVHRIDPVPAFQRHVRLLRTGAQPSVPRDPAGVTDASHVTATGRRRLRGMTKRRYEIRLPAEFNDGRLVADACPRCIPDSLCPAAER